MERRDVLKILEDLTDEDLKSILFLCRSLGIPSRDLESCTNGTDLYTHLEKRGHIKKDDNSLLPELLFHIGRRDLMMKMGVTPSGMKLDWENPSKIDRYWVFLYGLAQEIEDVNLEKMLFLLPDVNKNKIKSTLSFFIEMSKKEKVTKLNLGVLKDLLVNVNRYDLVKKLETFQEEEDFSHSVSETSPSDILLTPKHFETSAKIVLEAAEFSGKGKVIPTLNDIAEISEKLFKTSIKLTSPVAEQTPLSFEETGLASDYLTQPATPDVENIQLPRYPMDCNPRGFCIIINNKDFSQARLNEPDIGDRTGTDLDKDELVQTFKKFHFQVRVHENLTSEGMLDELKKIAKEDHKKFCAFFCCILSHGEDSCVLGVDGEKVLLQSLTSTVAGNNCAGLLYKPKVFIIQACQGNAEQLRCHLPQLGDLVQDGYGDTTDIPFEADILLALATVPGYYSYRSRTYGSWFIQTLCRLLNDDRYRKVDFSTLLILVNDAVSQKQAKMQMPEPRNRLRRLLYLD
uniref:caspase-8-like n=2 Tax=Myxine glutinosa TaxID=7769 RepID=UPI0035900CD6